MSPYLYILRQDNLNSKYIGKYHGFGKIKQNFCLQPIDRLRALYGNTAAPDNLDLFSGGLLETTPNGPGELFRTIILENFLRIRNGDRFWFENLDNGCVHCVLL